MRYLNVLIASQTSASGTFILESSEIRCTHLLLQWNNRKTSNKLAQTPQLIRIPADPLALNVKISQSNRSTSHLPLHIFQTNISSVQLGKPQSLMIVLSTGRNHIDKLALKLSSPSVAFRCKEAILMETEGEYVPLLGHRKFNSFYSRY